MKYLTFALAKGRLAKKTLELLEQIGITMEEMKQYHVLPKHLDGIVNQLRVTKGVEAAVFLYENEDGSYKVSTRSNGLVNVAELAVKFGGGGHERAAGFSMEGTPEDLINKVAFEIEKQL